MRLRRPPEDKPVKAKSKPAKTPDEVALTERQKSIMLAYRNVLGYPLAPANEGRENKAAQDLARLGYDPADVAACYLDMQKDAFWHGKCVSLVSVSKQIGPFLKRNEPIPFDAVETYG